MNNLYFTFFNLFASLFLLLAGPATAKEANAAVFYIDSLAQISTVQPAGTLFFFDLDDTVFDSPTMLGSKAWRKYIAAATKKIDNSRNWHDIFSYGLALKHPPQAVENITSAFIQDLQNKNYVVCGLTARERRFWYDMPMDGIDTLTIWQLLAVGVDFNNGRLEDTYPSLALDPAYYQGVFFADIEPKGNYLLHIFADVHQLPEKVIFIDDKKSQVDSVDQALTQLGIPHECYLYSATAAKEKAFNPLIANVQLYYFYLSNGKEVISEQKALQIAQDNPANDAEYYLRATLDFVKTHY